MEERRFIVWDGDGAPIGWFADFDAAHEWAHMRVLEPRTRLPVDVQDRRQKLSRRVDLGRCELVVWTETASLTGCEITGPRG